MKKILIITILAFMVSFTGTALAQKGPGPGGFVGPSQQFNQGGFTGPSEITTVTAAQVKNLPDNTPFIMVGKIEKHIGDKFYQFSDNTGSVTVKIGPKQWQGITVGPEDTVQLYGKVDKEWDRTEIKIKGIMKQ